MRTRAASFTAAICAALALWLTRGVLAVIGPGVDSPRVGLLEPAWHLALFMAAAAALAVFARWSLPAVVPFFCILLTVFPWLPVPVPGAFTLWTGHAAVAVWLAAIVVVIAQSPTLRQRLATSRIWRDPSRAMPAAMVIAFACYAVAAVRLAPVLPGGDEPHYLVITQSLLLDGDLRIENNHIRRDYLAYYPHELKPDYLRRGVDGQIYSIHAPGLSAIVAPAFALAGYRGVVLFLALLGAAATTLCWRLGWLLTRNPGAAWFGWAGAALTAPFFFHAFTMYPDGAAAAIVLIGIVALVDIRLDAAARSRSPLRDGVRWLGTGAALAVLPWLHTRYALLAAMLGAFLTWALLRTNTRRWRVAAFLAAPLAGAVAWFAFFKVVYGQLSPAAPYGGYTQSAASFIATGLPGMLFDQQFGMIANAPVIALVLPGLWLWARASRGRDALPFVAMAAVAVPYLLVASAYRMWWGGFSAPGRFAVPVVLLVAAPLALFWDRSTTFAARFVAAMLLAVSVGLTFVLAFGDEGRLLYNFRDGYASWLEWFSPLVNLPGALPSFFRGSLGVAAIKACVWLFAGLLVWMVVRKFESGWPAARAHLGCIGVLTSAAAVMLACTVGWLVGRDAPLRPAAAQVQLLEKFDPPSRPLAVAYAPFRFGDARGVPARLELPSYEPVRGAIRGVSYFQPRLPAGEYRIVLRGAPPARVDVNVGRGPRPIASVMPRENGARTQLLELTLPIDVSSVGLTSDGPFGSPPTLRPVRIDPATERRSDRRARSGARYGPVTVFALDEAIYLEPDGMWVRAGVDASLAVQPVEKAGVIEMTVRTGPTANVVSVDTGTRVETLNLQAGETRRVRLEADSERPVVFLKIRAEKGFRPKEVEPGVADDRLLGCWIEFD